MASSADELGSYEQSPRPVAGPSKPASKRKKAVTTNNIVEDVPMRDSLADAIAISSDEDVRPPNGRRTKAAIRVTPAASNGRNVSSKGKGKVTATGKRRKIDDTDQEDVVEETAAETEDDRAVGHHGPAKLASGAGSGKHQERLKRQLERLQKQLKEVSQQRDDMSSQLDQLFQLRNTEPEKQLAEQKAQYDARIKAQDDTIHELTSSLSRVDALSNSGGTTSLHFLTRETADEEKQDIQREVGRLTGTLKKRDATIADKDTKIHELDEMIKVLRADLKTEIENTKSLTSRNAPTSASKHPNKPSESKNALAIRLYEDLTNLLITNVKHEPGQYKEDDAVYTCVQTTAAGTSLNFTLKFTREPEEEQSPSSSKRAVRIVEKVVYTPLSLEREPPEFVEQLDFLAKPFTFQKEQTGVFTKTLMTYLEGEAEGNEDSVVLTDAEE